MSETAHLLTALSYMVIGATLLFVSIRVWFAHPINRVFKLGPFLSEDGLRLVLSMWPLVFLFGAFIFSCAIDHAFDYCVHRGWLGVDALDVSATAEAFISATTAICVVLAFVGHRRWWMKEKS